MNYELSWSFPVDLRWFRILLDTALLIATWKLLSLLDARTRGSFGVAGSKWSKVQDKSKRGNVKFPSLSCWYRRKEIMVRYGENCLTSFDFCIQQHFGCNVWGASLCLRRPKVGTTWSTGCLVGTLEENQSVLSVVFSRGNFWRSLMVNLII